MPAMIRGEVSDGANPKLDVFMKDSSDTRVNVAELSFQVFEKVTNPSVPVQIYPASGRQTVDLNVYPTGDRLDVGRYVAEYEVPVDALIGTHEIRWFTRYSPSSPEQSYTEEFEVLSDAPLGVDDMYVSVADVRAAGLSVNPPDDPTIFSSILLWQQVLERVTRQWFRAIECEFYLDGTDSDTLHLPVPIISISEVRLNTDTTALDSKRYRVYAGRRLPDDRKNPRIKLVDNFDGYGRDIYTASDRTSRSRFFHGRQNQFVKGVFGYVEPDGSTPALIKRAMLKLVVSDLSNPIVPGAGSGLTPPPITAGLVREEVTDGHSIKYDVAGGDLKARAPGLSGLINDPEVQMIVKLYKAPIGMATPPNPTWT
jgi:hypothetical protein